jgi:hypothetical protein
MAGDRGAFRRTERPAGNRLGVKLFRAGKRGRGPNLEERAADRGLTKTKAIGEVATRGAAAKKGRRESA